MGAKYGNSYILNADIKQVCTVISDFQFCSFLKLGFKSENPIQGGIMYFFNSSANLSSWGEDIDITVLYHSETTAQVIIKSKCTLPTQVIDWGKNKANVEKIYNYLTSRLAYTPPLNNAQSQQATAVRFCTKCGARLDAAANFCYACGAQVI